MKIEVPSYAGHVPIDVGGIVAGVTVRPHRFGYRVIWPPETVCVDFLLSSSAWPRRQEEAPPGITFWNKTGLDPSLPA